MMRFKIDRRDGTIIYANDICISGGILQKVGIWTAAAEIDSMSLDDVSLIWALFPDHNTILIYV